MVAAAVQLDDRQWSWALATRPVGPDRRRVPRNDYVLFDGDGRQLGAVRAVAGAPEFGPTAPELFLQRSA